MYVLTVTPLVRGTLKGALTYFSKNLVEEGHLVTIPLRRREVPALVTEVSAASNEKAILKNSDYKVKKIIRSKPCALWNAGFIKAAKETSLAHFQGLGETLLALTPKAILDEYFNKQITADDIQRTTRNKTSPSRIFAIQGDTKMRPKSYEHFIRKSFKQNESVFVCAPTQDDVERMAHELRDHKENILIFHSGVSKKKLLRQWEKAREDTTPLLVVGTPQYLSLPKHFGTFILEDEHARSWNTFTRPFIDIRYFVEVYARTLGSTLVLGAPILRIETHKKILDKKIKLIHANTEVSHKKTILIDPRIEEKDIKEHTGRRTLQILGKEVRAMIKDAQDRDENIFLLVARKGLAPLVVCGDCGHTLRCPVCNKLLVLHKKEGMKDARIFSCHSCGFHRAPEGGEDERCPTCGGWRLEGLGIGTERVEEDLKRLFPSAPRFILDGDHTKTRASARKVIDSFEKSKKGILIGTPMAIPFLSTVSATAIISLDSLLAIPDFRMNERIFALVLTLREKTKEKLLLQTRLDDTALFKQALLGNAKLFVKNELMVRKSFSYPPYGTIIKITLSGGRAQIPVEMKKLTAFLSEYHPLVPQTITRKKNIFQMSMVLKLKEKTSAVQKLFFKLRTLPPQFIIEVNPDSLF